MNKYPLNNPCRCDLHWKTHQYVVPVTHFKVLEVIVVMQKYFQKFHMLFVTTCCVGKLDLCGA